MADESQIRSEAMLRDNPTKFSRGDLNLKQITNNTTEQRRLALASPSALAHHITMPIWRIQGTQDAAVELNKFTGGS